MKRRQFIQGTSSAIPLIFLAGLPLFGSCNSGGQGTYPLLQEFLPQNDLNAIVNYLADTFDRNMDFPEDMEADLEERIRADFENQNTVICNGWVLAKSEAVFLLLNQLEA
ncbi:hypothetical protein [Maribacter sp. 2307ULW6-5]|uniref:hypothetical protein n=1 Tax=Maribacter sp. 2307ULW6-5 TaxID=3386275 RepID=UPI0039BCE2A1